MLFIDALCFAPQSLYAQNGCIPTYSSRLQVGERVYVLPSPLGPNLARNRPSKQSVQIGQIAVNEEMTLIDGPQCADGWLWWYVRSDTGIEGWTSERQEGEYWLGPIAPRSAFAQLVVGRQTTYINCPDDKQTHTEAVSVHNRLVVGGYAVVQVDSGDVIHLYASESYEKLIDELPRGSYLSVLDGPRCVKGNGNNYYQRWLVQDLRTRLVGWASEGGRDVDGQIHYWLAPDTLYQACPDSYPSRIKNGDWVYMAWSENLLLHRTPRKSGSIATEKVLGQNKIVQVVDGPVCADGWTFWLLDVDGNRYYASEGDPNNPNKGYWLAPISSSNVPNWQPVPEVDNFAPVESFLSFQNAINERDFRYAYSLLSKFFQQDLCYRVKACTIQQFGNGYTVREFVTFSDVRNEHQGKASSYWVFDATYHPEGTAKSYNKTVCMLFEAEQWKVHGILLLGSKICG